MKRVVYRGGSHYREVTLGPLMGLEDGDERYNEILRWDPSVDYLDLEDDVAHVLPLMTSKKEWLIGEVDDPELQAAVEANVATRIRRFGPEPDEVTTDEPEEVEEPLQEEGSVEVIASVDD